MAEAKQTKVQSGIQDINQAFKERDIQSRAKQRGLPYISLINVPVNSDLAGVLSKEKSLAADAVIFFKSGKKLRLAVADPDKAETQALIRELEAQEYAVQVNLCTQESLKSAQRMYFTDLYEKHFAPENVVVEKDLGSFIAEIENLGQLKEKIEHAAYDIGLNYIQVGGYKTAASDIHFQPQEKSVLVRFRIDGVLRPVFELTREIYEGLLKEIKYLSHLKLNITTLPQDGQYRFLINGRAINVRVSVLPSQFGETCVMRLLDPLSASGTFESLGFEGEALKHLTEVVNLPHGMVLVTGPTGSGKTTTLYALLRSIDTRAKKVITLEDPIEYQLEGITQSQVHPEQDYDFSTGLRAILRQDPDVIMVGEIRDLETAETAAQASLTGHLVVSTLHTNSAVESIPRLVNMGVKSFILAPALDLIVAQRLVRKLCPDCSHESAITETEKEHIALAYQTIAAKGLPVPAMPAALRRVAGCATCGDTGYRGQIAIAEVLRFTNELRDLILNNRPMSEVYDHIQKHSRMLSLVEDGVLKVVRGVTTLDEVYRVAV